MRFGFHLHRPTEITKVAGVSVMLAERDAAGSCQTSRLSPAGAGLSSPCPVRCSRLRSTSNRAISPVIFRRVHAGRSCHSGVVPHWLCPQSEQLELGWLYMMMGHQPLPHSDRETSSLRLKPNRSKQSAGLHDQRRSPRPANSLQVCKGGNHDLGVMLATRGRAHHAVEHPQRNLKGQTCSFAGQAASRDRVARFIQYTVNRDDASGPRMPVVKNPLFAGNVGVQAPSCTIPSGRIARSDTDRRPQKPSCQTLMGQPTLLMGYGWPINLTRAKL